MPYVGRDLQRGNYLKLDDISSSFDGSTTTFNLTSGGNAFFPGSAFSIIVSLGGVVQEPESAFQIDKSQIIFAQAPTPNDDFFCIVQGVSLGVGVPGHNTVGDNQLSKPISYSNYFRWDSANNRVGINTLSPSVALDVIGDASFSGNVAIGGTLTYEDVTNIDAVGLITARAGIEDKTLDTGHVVFAGTGGRLVGEAELFYDTSNNRLGIGTNSPTDVLDVYSDTDPTIRSRSGSSTVGANVEICGGSSNDSQLILSSGTTSKYSVFRDGSQSDDLRIYDSANSLDIIRYRHGAYLHFGVNGEERLRITDEGKVGIGTNNPDGLLEVYNSSTSGNTVLKIHNDKTGDAAQLRLEGGRTSINDCAQVVFANSGNLVSGIIANSAADDGNLTFRTSASGSNSALTTYGHIATDGKVKFGKNAGSSPGARFHVEDDDTTAYDPDATTSASSVYLVNTGTNGPMGIILQNASGDGSNTCQATIHSVAESNNKNTALTFGTRQNSDATIRERLRIKSDGTINITTANGSLQWTASSGSDPFIRSIGSGQQSLEFNTGGDERLRITSDGKLLLNNISSRAVANVTPQVQLEGTTANTSAISITRNSDNASPPYLSFGKSRATSTGGTTIIQDDDNLGEIRFSGADGNDLTNHAASINAEIDGTPSNNVTPGRLIFSTTSSTGSDPTERLRIKSNGQVRIQTNGGDDTPAKLQLHSKDVSIVTGDHIGEIRFTGKDSAVGAERTGALIDVTAAANWDTGQTSGYTASHLDFHTQNNSGTDTIAAGPRVRITSDGKVGINATNPKSMFEVYESSTTQSETDKRIAIFRKSSGASVGDEGYIHLTTMTGHYGVKLGFANEGASPNYLNQGFFISTVNSGENITNHTKKFVIKSDGDIGIGTVSPNCKLVVYDSAAHTTYADSTPSVGDCMLQLYNEPSSEAAGHHATLQFGVKGGSHNRVNTISAVAENAGNRKMAFTFCTDSGSNRNERMRITADGNVGINNTNPNYTLEVTGSFAATTKSFVIDHPTKENYSLRYACLEGPENSVYVRGRSSDPVIELPDYWTGLVHEDSITVNVTPIGNHKVWVESINNNSVTIGSDGSEYFYTVFAERKDVDKLEVEVAK